MRKRRVPLKHDEGAFTSTWFTKLGRPALALLATFTLSTGLAQGAYVGISGGTNCCSPQVIIGAQVGGNLTSHFAVRVFVDIFIGNPNAPAVVRIAGDALYTDELAANTTGYVGGGAGILISGDAFLPLLPDVHLTGGVEYRVIEELGVYAEVQLLLVIPIVKVGVNFHF